MTRPGRMTKAARNRLEAHTDKGTGKVRLTRTMGEAIDRLYIARLGRDRGIIAHTLDKTFCALHSRGLANAVTIGDGSGEDVLWSLTDAGKRLAKDGWQ